MLKTRNVRIVGAFGIISALMLGHGSPPAWAATAAKPRAGAKCTTVSQVQIYGDIAFRCVQKGKAKVWVSKKLTPAEVAAVNGGFADSGGSAATPTTVVAGTVVAGISAAPVAGGIVTNPGDIMATDAATLKAALVGRFGFPAWWPVPTEFNRKNPSVGSINASETYNVGAKSRSTFRKTDYYSASLDLESQAKAALAQIPDSAGFNLASPSTSTGEQDSRKFTRYEVRNGRVQTFTVTVFETGDKGKPSSGSAMSLRLTSSVDSTDALPPVGSPALSQFQDFPVPTGMTWASGEVSMLAFIRYSGNTKTSWAGQNDFASLKAFYNTATLPAGFTFGAVSYDKPDAWYRKLTYKGFEGELRIFASSSRSTVDVEIKATQDA
jgi:hypothetical protein